MREQAQIAAYLDASCVAIDAAVGAKRRQLEALDALRKSIITSALTRGLNKDVVLSETRNVWINRLPNQWDLVCLKRIAEIQTGLTLGKTY